MEVKACRKRALLRQKEVVDSPEKEKKLVKDRDESADPKSQRETGADQSGTSDTHGAIIQEAAVKTSVISSPSSSGDPLDLSKPRKELSRKRHKPPYPRYLSKGHAEKYAFCFQCFVPVERCTHLGVRESIDTKSILPPLGGTQPAPQLHRWSSDPGWSRRDCSSSPSLSHMTSEPDKLPRAFSLPNMRLKSSFEEFTPDISADDETYRFLCSCPGLYQCSVTGLVFDMEGEGDVVYRVATWNRRLLAQHHKKPAGPLFDIKCVQQSVCQLHLPHCEISSTGGAHFLSVAHVSDEGIEFIRPQKISETHVVINITGFSGFGNVKDEDSPPDPVRALVLLFYRPPDDPDVTSFLSVLLLPRNIVIRDLLRTRRKLVGDERYIDASPHCKLQPKQVYTLSTCPEDNLIKVQPRENEFDEESHDSYFTSFQVILKATIRDINLSLRNKESSCCVWEREVCLLPSRERTQTLSADARLFNIRSSFIDGISGPVLQTLLDKLLQKSVITDSEREAADVEKTRRDKARFVIDMVRRKGDAASSEMIEILCELDLYLCRTLGLN